MRTRRLSVVLTVALLAIAAACSSSSPATGPGGGGGGSSTTITASSTTTGGGAYGAGGNYFFSPTPDTVAAGTAVTYSFGSVTHNVHFDAVANAPDSIQSSTDTSIARTFTTAGTYNYRCTIHNITGVVIVQ